MNLVFGAIGVNGKRCFEHALQWITAVYGQDTQRVALSESSGGIGYLSDNGKLLGKSESAGRVLFFIGTLLPECSSVTWAKQSDAADEIASLLLARYEQLGKTFLDCIAGSFALVLYDRQEESLFIAGDKTGSRRIFYRQSDDSIVFGTNLKLVAKALSNSCPIDRSYEDFLLGYEFLPWNRTLYQGVSTLQGGVLLEWSRGEIKCHEIKPPDLKTPLPAKVLSTETEDVLVDELYRIFIAALKEQIPQDEKIGVLLGGFDSALIASCLTKLGKDVHTFSFYFEDQAFNQPFTDTLSSFAGTTHHWVPISPELIAEGLTHFSEYFNQPVGQAHYLIESLTVCRAIRREGISFAFTGDGCDGIFLGYPTVHRRAKLFEKLGLIPPWITKRLLRASDWGFLERWLGHPYRVFRNVLQIASRAYPSRGYIASRILDQSSLRRLRLDPAPAQEKDIEEILTSLAAGFSQLSPLRLAYLGKAAVGLNKNKLEGSSAGSGVVLQSPYLHPRVVEFANSLPEELLRKEGHESAKLSGKYLLIKMTERYRLLPPEIIYQRKRSPVHSPVDHWYATELRPWILELVKALPFRYREDYFRGLLRPKLAEDIYRKYVSIDEIASHAPCLLVTYASFNQLEVTDSAPSSEPRDLEIDVKNKRVSGSDII